MFQFFTKDDLISHNQSGFKPGDSFINKLLSITPEIYKSFDDGLDVRGVFLDISKVIRCKVWHKGKVCLKGKVDKVWHKGLIYKF